MINPRIKEIKRAQKESLLYRELSNLLMQLTIDHPELRDLTLTRVNLSGDKSLCTVYFYTQKGTEDYKEKLELLKLYKGSIRKAIAAQIEARYTPELRFAFDDRYEKQERFEGLMEDLKKGD